MPIVKETLIFVMKVNIQKIDIQEKHDKNQCRMFLSNFMEIYALGFSMLQSDYPLEM